MAFFLGTSGGDTLIGTEDVDLFLGREGNDVIYGLGGNDLLYGNEGNDHLFGGDGNDFLKGGPGADYYHGGSDIGYTPGSGGVMGDRVTFFELGATQGVSADLRTGIVSNDGFGNQELMVGIESLSGTTIFRDELYGNDGANLLIAGVGDVLLGFAGDDLFGTSGAAELVDGGDGVDLLQVMTDSLVDSDNDGIAELGPNMTAGYQIDLQSGIVVDGFGNTGVVAGIENVGLTHLDDSIAGDESANLFLGHDGNDALDGRGGDDVLTGGFGQDTLTGGEGADGFVFQSLSDSIPAAPDLITDFDLLQDHIDLTAIAADLGITLSYAGKGFTGQAGEIYLEYDKAAGVTHLQLDADGDALADMVIDLAGRHKLTPGRFDQIFSDGGETAPAGLSIAAEHVPEQVTLPFGAADYLIF